MIRTYSNVAPGKLLHIIYNLNDVEQRIDLVDESNFLQCAVIREKAGKTYKPHIHITKPVPFTEYNAQESWLVFKGRIRVYHFDIDGSRICSYELSSGDINITLAGGHTLEILEETQSFASRRMDRIMVNC
jgi:hypothetical protein